MNEEEQLNQIASRSLYATVVNTAMIRYTYQLVQRYLPQGTVLELGPAEGAMTRLLVDGYKDVTVVEGSALFCEQLRQENPTVKVHHSLFEAFEPDQCFDNIVLSHVLEHVETPEEILRRVRCWLAPHTGRLFAAVPNAHSIHRQAAVLMGLLPQEDALNAMDKHHGHRRVFNADSFQKLFLQAELQVEVFGGYWLKPVSNQQIEENWTAEMLDAFMQLGERYPEIAAEIYIVAKR